VHDRRRARLLVRPAAVRFASPEDPAVQLRARVCDAAFRGRGYDYAVLFDAGMKLVGIRDERRWKRGAVVGLSLDPEGCLLLPEDPGPTDADAAPSEHPTTAGVAGSEPVRRLSRHRGRRSSRVSARRDFSNHRGNLEVGVSRARPRTAASPEG